MYTAQVHLNNVFQFNLKQRYELYSLSKYIAALTETCMHGIETNQLWYPNNFLIMTYCAL